MQDVSVRNRLLSIVSSILAQNELTADLDPESHLVDVGLHSIDMVAVMLRVEAEFDFTIPQPQINPENFQSVKTLELMILNQLGAGVG
ncbi:MAG: acyl carrier protein [Bradyrhizobium sp.]